MNKKLGNRKIGQNLSSETLFHLTWKFDNLKSILTNGFQAGYIYEKLPGTGRRLAYLTKTICFCDIPLGVIKEHINWYGEYGIGINRPKARENGLSPVLYLHSKSPTFPRGSSSKSIEWFDQFDFTRCLKQVRGKQIFFKDNMDEPYWKWKTFYNEREWRYFPSDQKESKTNVIKYEKEEELEKKRIEINGQDQPNAPWILQPEWIEYIIIRDTKDLDKLKDILKSKYKSNYESLLTKIITIKQIVNDF